MSSERESTGAVRRVADVDDAWARRERAYAQPASEDAVESFFTADPATAARTMLATGAVTTENRKAERYEARKVRRLVRHIEPWSVLKISLIFYFCIWIILLVAGTILWRVADGSSR